MKDSKRCLALSPGQKFTSGIHEVVDALIEARAQAHSLNHYRLDSDRREKFKELLTALDSAAEVLEEVFDECDSLPTFDEDAEVIGAD